jgi:predicted dienelactone hydrolase
LLRFRAASVNFALVFRTVSPGRPFAAALVVVTLVCAVPPISGQAVARREWAVGGVTRSFVPAEAYNWRGAATHELVASVWYPAAAGTSASEHDIGPSASPLFRLGTWADDARPADGPFPLLVLSHGTGGSAQIMAWLALGLASRGYVVAAVNHPGNNALEAYTVEGFLMWWERAHDLTATIDALFRDKELGRVIDTTRIGGVGFSLGRYTVVEIAGGRTDPRLFQDFCRSAAAEGCADPPEFPNLFARWAELETTSSNFRAAVSHAGDSYRDSRVRSVFAIAPALGPAFIPDSLQRISIPVAILAGEDDRIVPAKSNAQRLAGAIPGARLTLLPGGVGHYTFLATCTENGRRTQPQLCTDATGIDRQAVHQQAIESAVQFFDKTLN